MGTRWVYSWALGGSPWLLLAAPVVTACSPHQSFASLRDQRGCIVVVLARDDREAARVLRQDARDLERNAGRKQQLRLALDLWRLRERTFTCARRGEERTAENGEMSMPRRVRIWKIVRSPVEPRNIGFCSKANERSIYSIKPRGNR